MKKVGFRVDGNAKIGMGHVMRTLALAGAFSRRSGVNLYSQRGSCRSEEIKGIPAGVKNNYPAS